MKVREVMNPRPVTIASDAPIGDAGRLMREAGISGMPVVDGDKLVGVISESDLLRILSRGEKEPGSLWLPSPFEIFELPIRDVIAWERLAASARETSRMWVSDVMSRSVRSISPEATVEEAAEMMTRHRVNRLPVVENGRLVGIVTRGDIIAGLGGGHAED